MIKNYLKVAVRYLLRNRIFSIINIFGLSVGIASSLLVFIYVIHERSYDKFLDDYEHIYRMRAEGKRNSGEIQFSSARCFPAGGPEMATRFDEIIGFNRILKDETLIRFDPSDDPSLLQSVEDVYVTDSTFFEIFSYPLIVGDKSSVLDESNSVLLSKSFARRIYGHDQDFEKLTGKSVSLYDYDYVITGVFEDVPDNTHLKFDILLAYPPSEMGYFHGNWASNIAFTYLKLRPGTNPIELESKFPSVLDEFKGAYFKETSYREDFYLQPIADIHLNSNFIDEARINGNTDTVSLLAFIGVLIMLIAWINYINLSTARAIERAKEVGVRKSTGATRKNLLIQFLFESFLLNLVGLIIAYTIIQMALPAFSNFTGKILTDSISTIHISYIFIIILLTGSFLSGVYPAFLLSAYKPSVVLKGLKSNTHGGWLLRKGLVVLQFIFTLALIATTLVIYKQLTFMQNQELGIGVMKKVIVKAPETRSENYVNNVELFKNEVVKISSIENASSTAYIPSQNGSGWGGYIRRIESSREEVKSYRRFPIDHGFIEHYGIEIIAGRNFSRDFANDTASVILSETALYRLGFTSPEESIGKFILYPIKNREDGKYIEVIGVTKDFHQVSLKEHYLPIIFDLDLERTEYFTITIESQEFGTAISQINNIYSKIFEDEVFDFFFLDSHFEKQYAQEQQFGLVIGLFTTLSIIIASLGLFGLASFAATQRIKEIGIRKVMGASSLNIYNMFSRQYLKLIVISAVIAIPLTYFASNTWLNNFAFSIEIGPWFFIFPLVIAGLIALLSISFQILRSASNNPADLLRYE